MTSLFKPSYSVQSNSHVAYPSLQSANRPSPFYPLAFSPSLKTYFAQATHYNKHRGPLVSWHRSHVLSDLNREPLSPRTPKTYRTFVADASFFRREKGSAASYHVSTIFKLTFDIFGLILKIPYILWRLFTNEKSILEEVEEDVDKAAQVVKETAKVVEKIAEGAEKIAKGVEEDAEKVEVFTDKVEAITKKMHKDVDQAFDALETSVEGVKNSQSSETKVADEEKEGEGLSSRADTTTSSSEDTIQTSSYVASSLKASSITRGSWQSFKQIMLKAGCWLDSGMVTVMVRAFLLVVCFMVVGFFSGEMRFHDPGHQLLMRSSIMRL